ncbi:MAG: M23 family metallopeptidase, partial [Cyanobacteriota bacterium]|nr:M23 family metallopeptidase [Cyanobacteriota bacterium]
EPLSRALSGALGLGMLGLGLGVLGLGAPGPGVRAAEQPLAGQGAPREVEVGDLGSNTRLPEALRPVYFPIPAEFAERLPVGGALARRESAVLEDGRAGAEEMPTLGYPINQAPIEVSRFGMRWSESRGAWRMHTGLDLIVTEGTPVLAAATGTVRLVEEVSGYGLTVLVDHGQGWQTLYGHLFEIAVQPGETVHRGQPLGRVGESGRASTPHLHFEIRRRRGERVVALDPEPILRSRQPGALVRQPGANGGSPGMSVGSPGAIVQRP